MVSSLMPLFNTTLPAGKKWELIGSLTTQAAMVGLKGHFNDDFNAFLEAGYEFRKDWFIKAGFRWVF